MEMEGADEKWKGVGKGQGGRRTGITVVGVLLRAALCDLEVVLRDDLVEGVSAAAELLAGVAVAVIPIASASGLVRFYLR